MSGSVSGFTHKRARLHRVTPRTGFDWPRIARLALLSRALDDLEETTNRNRARVRREDLILYQFSARGHEVTQAMLGTLLAEPHDAVGAYYRSRPLLLSLGLTVEDALGSPLGRAGGYSDGRDIGVVANLPNPAGCTVLPVAGDVGSQYTPAAGWAQSILYHRDNLNDSSWNRSISVVCGGDGSVATNGFWSALTMATTLKLPMLFFVEDNGLGISVHSDMQTPGGDIARNLASFSGLLVVSGDGSNPHDASGCLDQAVSHVRSGDGPALVRLTVPRLSSHSGPDNQSGYRSKAEIEADNERDPLPNLRDYLVPALMSSQEWSTLEKEVQQEVSIATEAARARPNPEPLNVAKHIYADSSLGHEAMGGLSVRERESLSNHTTDAAGEEGPLLRFAEAIRHTLRHELRVNPKLVVFGEDVGRKGGVHLVTEGLQKEFGEQRVFDTSLNEEGIVGRAVGMAISGLVPVAEIQFRKYADPATEQLNNCGTIRWRTANRFAAPIVVRMPGGYGKDVGDPWHSLSDEVRFAHSYGWQVAIPSNSVDAVGLLRTAMRSPDPTIFFEHRSLLMTGEGSAHYPGDNFALPFGAAHVLTTGSDLTLVTWGAMVHRCRKAISGLESAVELIDLRTISPWDRQAVLGSVKKTGRCLIVHEDNITAGFGAEIAAAVASDAFWFLDAPVERLAPEDIPIPYHPTLLDTVIPNTSTIRDAIGRLLSM